MSRIDGAAHHRVALRLTVCFFCPDAFLLEPERSRRCASDAPLPATYLTSYSTRTLMIDGAAHHLVALPRLFCPDCFFCPDAFLSEPEDGRWNDVLAGVDFGTEHSTFGTWTSIAWSSTSRGFLWEANSKMTERLDRSSQDRIR